MPAALTLLTLAFLFGFAAKAWGEKPTAAALAHRRRAEETARHERDAFAYAVAGAEEQLGRKLTALERWRLRRLARLTIRYHRERGDF